jgi:O-antigen ligase
MPYESGAARVVAFEETIEELRDMSAHAQVHATSSARRRAEAEWWGRLFIRTARACLYLFAVSLPFESVDVGLQIGNWTIARLAGYALVAAAIPAWRVALRRPPAVFWWFASYVFILALLTLIVDPAYRSLAVVRLSQMVQLLFLFFVSCNIMRHDPRVPTRVLLSYGAASVVLSLTQSFGFTAIEYQARATAFKENPNTVGAMFALTIVLLIGFAFGRSVTGWKFRLISLALVTVAATQLIATGSRGALLAALVGVAVVIMRYGSIWLKLRIAIGAAVMLLVIGNVAMQNEIMRNRIETSLKTFDLAEREQIFPLAWQMFLERPIAGWGPEKHYFELGWRIGDATKEQHNLLLWLLNETGILGTLPYAVALGLCAIAAWRARRGVDGAIPLALFMTLMTINLSNMFQNRKIYWLLLAYIVVRGTIEAGSQAGRRFAARSSGRLPRGAEPAVIANFGSSGMAEN